MQRYETSNLRYLVLRVVVIPFRWVVVDGEKEILRHQLIFD